MTYVYLFQTPQCFIHRSNAEISRIKAINTMVLVSRARVWFAVVNMAQERDYGEGCGLEGPLRCIFLCEFHPTAGPKITCQVWTFTFKSVFVIVCICVELSFIIVIFSSYNTFEGVLLVLSFVVDNMDTFRAHLDIPGLRLSQVWWIFKCCGMWGRVGW
jgi:hypothetical protein